ncbi:hypothetical protein [Janthinobacterium fluminis]|uniref:Bulb-type lectin domain-containing protein n=1 Tax=Janthinobacterium fluminis TaxID=2987524 RepID=A0ABT5K4E7_9BURK|nr:hypothetical protein [Janthinobacterium fluminis]MDC8759570.1 hypothetical protein [Janthinobacterium fluminis]
MKTHTMKLICSALLALSAAGAHAKEMLAGQALQIGQTLESDNGKYFLIQQGDGNLVVYRKTDMKPIWASYANGTMAVIQHDGNFVQYNSANVAVWNSQTGGHADNANFKLAVADNGPAYVMDANKKILWYSTIDPDAPTVPIPGPCYNGNYPSYYATCMNPGTTYQFQGGIMACDYSEARIKAFPAQLGYCPYVPPR